MADSEKIINIIKELANNDNTVIVIEHNLDVIAQADWIIDVGPEGGIKGGKITFEGTVTDLLQSNSGFTAEYLNSYVSS